MPAAIDPTDHTGRQLYLASAPHPLSTEHSLRAVEAGGTLAELLEQCDLDRALMMGAHIYVGDSYVAREWWAHVRPKPGQLISVRVVPMGGGGGGGKKNPLRTVLQIAVLAAAFGAGAYFAGAGIGPVMAFGGAEINLLSAVAPAAIGLVGNLVVDAIAPPPTASLAGLSGFEGGLASSPNFTLEGARNDERPWQPIPRLYGRLRMAPPRAVKTYTESVGNDQYLRLLLTFGYGPMRISDIRIGDTALANYTGVDHEIREGWDTDSPLTLFTNDVYEEALSLLLEQREGWVTRTTQIDVDEITTDVVWPRGLVRYTDQGDRISATVEVEVQIAVAGSGSWQTVPWAEPGLEGFEVPGRIRVTAQAPEALRMGGRIKVTQGQYDVRWRRITQDNDDDDQIFDEVYVAALRSVKYQAPVTQRGLAMLALRVKATDQLNGVIDRLTALCESYLKVWNGASWSWQLSRNPAWAYADVLQGPANLEPMGDERLRLDDLMAWAAANDAAGWTFDAVFDFDTTINRALDQIAAAGRAARGMVDSRHTVVRDEVQTVPVQHFTPRNSWGFRSRKTLTDVPHALAVRFQNEQADYQQDVRTVYRDGYSESNATDIEETDYFGLVNPDRIWARARIDMATGDLRPEVSEINADIEHLVAGRGDLVRVAHDAMLVGVKQGRIKSLTTNPQGEVDGMFVDEVCPMLPGRSYAVTIRRDDNTEIVNRAIVNPGTGDDTTYLEWQVPMPASEGAWPKPGDLFMYGEAGRVSGDYKILRIEQRADLAARIELVDAAPNIDDAITGPIPEFDSNITRPYPNDVPLPVPVVASIVSDESVLVADTAGTWRAQIVVTFDPVKGDFAQWQTTYLEAQYRVTGTNAGWLVAGSIDVDSSQLAIRDVDTLQRYDLRFRYVNNDGTTSAWTYRNDYLVVGKSTPPPDPGVLYVERLASNVSLRPRYRYRLTDYNPPRDMAGFVYRWHPEVNLSWADAVPFGPQPVVDDNFEADALIDTSFTVMVKAIDQAGNESVGFSYAIVQGPKPTDSNVLDTIDYKAMGWPGTHNGIIDGDGNLTADTGGPFFTDPNAPLFTDPDAPIIGDFNELRYEFRYQAPFWGTLNFARKVNRSHKLRYSLAGSGLFFTDPNAPLFTDPDVPLFSSADDVPPVEFVGPFMLSQPPLLVGYFSAPGGAVQAVLSQLEAVLEPERFFEYVEDLTLPSGGARIALQNEYDQLLTVTSDIQSHSGGGTHQAVVVLVDDKDPINGPYLRALAANGNNTEAIIDVQIAGIPIEPSGSLST